MFFITKTLLIDGNYLLKRSYNGAKHTFNSKGKNIGGLYQFIVMLRKLIIDNSINKCVVFFDGNQGGRMRFELYPLYKANRESKSWYNKTILTEKQIYREEEEKTLLWQKMRIQQYLENLFIRQLEVEMIESDDLIAQYCKIMSDKEHIIIYTNDRDMCQLLKYDKVNVYLANLNMLINKDNYFVRFKHDVSNAKLLKVLCGDSSDNIMGVKGLGESTIIEHFPEFTKKPLSLEYVIEKSKQINEERVSKKQKPLKALENIYKGVFNELGEVGIENFELNDKIIDLLSPMLTPRAVNELEDIAKLPLDLDGRTSKNLLNMMNEDDFLLNYQSSDFNRFVNPFLNIIIREKEFSKKS